MATQPDTRKGPVDRIPLTGRLTVTTGLGAWWESAVAPRAASTVARVQLDLFQGDVPAAEAGPATDRPRIEIRVSARRRKTIAAHWEGETIVVVVPQRLSKKDRLVYAEELSAKLIAGRDRSRPTDEALTARAAALSARYLGGAAVPASVTWTARQQAQWGSCTAADRTIRLSDRLKGVPGWVLDAVLVHELAHLLHSDHGPEFQALVARYPRTADADVFLDGYALGLGSASQDQVEH